LFLFFQLYNLKSEIDIASTKDINVRYSLQSVIDKPIAPALGIITPSDRDWETIQLEK
jgi:hypothetical protein